MRKVYRFHEQTKCSLELFNDCLAQGSKINVWVGVVEELGEFCNALGVGVSLESETLSLKQSLEFLVVCDNAIVDDSKFPLRVRSVPRQSMDGPGFSA